MLLTKQVLKHSFLIEYSILFVLKIQSVLHKFIQKTANHCKIMFYSDQGWKNSYQYVKIMLTINPYLIWRIFAMKAIKRKMTK